MPEPSHLAAEFVERDERQALRMQRYLIAAGTSVLVCLMLISLAFLQALPWRAVLAGMTVIAVLLVIFYVVFRTGLNLRFVDPSLTTEQAARSGQRQAGGGHRVCGAARRAAMVRGDGRLRQPAAPAPFRQPPRP